MVVDWRREESGDSSALVAALGLARRTASSTHLDCSGSALIIAIRKAKQ